MGYHFQGFLRNPEKFKIAPLGALRNFSEMLGSSGGGASKRGISLEVGPCSGDSQFGSTLGFKTVFKT